MYEQYLIRLLAPLSLYNLRAPHNGGELAALGGELDSVSGLVELVERESLLATAESEGLDRVDMKLADNQIELLQAVEQFIGAVVVRFAAADQRGQPDTGGHQRYSYRLRHPGQSGGKGGRQPAGRISQNCRCAGGVRPDQEDYFRYSTLSFGGGVLLPLSDLGRM